jgi:cytochrome c-type biogenesis protein CcmH/NrfG
MNAWLPCPYAADYRFDAAQVRAQWARLHALDAEPLPADEAVLRAWTLFHGGQFEAAEAAGLQAGGAGMAVANRATAAYATLIEPHEKPRLDLYQRIHERARAQIAVEPRDASGWYWMGYGLARCAQGIHVARALAQGIGGQIRGALETALELSPGHAFAHAALGGFHAEVIDKVGPLVAAMAYGARADIALQHLREARRLAPDSAAVLLDFAAVLLLIDGQTHLAEATRLQEQAAQLQPRDAAERLWIELALANLQL